MTRLCSLVSLAVLLVAGCEKAGSTSEAFSPIDPAVIEIAVENAVVQMGAVGIGESARPRTYLLVDAKNTAGKDVVATIEGKLFGGISLSRQSLRIPAGGVRTFALVARREPAAKAPATVESLEVTRALVPRKPPYVVVEDGHVFRDGDRVVAQASIHNTAKRRVQAIVVAGFYDAQGRILERPFTALVIDGGQSFPVQFVGPEGSRRAYIFVGQTEF